MAIHNSHPLQRGGTSPNGPLAHAHSMQPSHEVAAHAAHNTSGTTPNTETKFLPLHVAIHWVNLIGHSVPRKTSLQEWRERSKRSGTERTRHGAAIPRHEAVVPVAGRARTADVSLVLNLLRDNSGDDQPNQVEEALKARNLNRSQRLRVYINAAENVDRAGLSLADADRVKKVLEKAVKDIQYPDRDKFEPAIHDPKKLYQVIKELFPTWPELRQAMHGPDRLSEEIEVSLEELENLKAVTPRELRSGWIRVHTAVDGVLPRLKPSDIVKFAYRIVGPELCAAATSAFRRIAKSRY
jgi:hypothetical protein